MVKMNLKPGDKVKIKTWDAMKEEFGAPKDDQNIPVVRWNEDVENDMPKDRIITLGEQGMSEDGCVKFDGGFGQGWTVYPEAVECVVEDEPTPISEAEANEAKAEDVSPFYWEGPCELQKARAETLENVVTRKNRQLLRLEEEIHRLRDSDSGGTKEAFSELEYRCERSEERLRIIESVINPDID